MTNLPKFHSFLQSSNLYDFPLSRVGAWGVIFILLLESSTHQMKTFLTQDQHSGDLVASSLCSKHTYLSLKMSLRIINSVKEGGKVNMN